MEAARIPLDVSAEEENADVRYLMGLRERVHQLGEQHALPDDGEQIILTRQFQRGRLEAARMLVRNNRALVRFVVEDFTGSPINDPELLTSAAGSIISAAKNFDPYRHGPFAEHAAIAMMIELRSADTPTSSTIEKSHVSQHILEALWDVGTKNHIDRSDNAPPITPVTQLEPSLRSQKRRKRHTDPVHIEYVPPQDEAPAEIVKAPTMEVQTPAKRAGINSVSYESLATRAQEGDKHAANELMLRGMKMAKYIAYKMGLYLPNGEMEDLYQEGLATLTKNIGRFDSRQSSYKNFAYLVLTRAMLTAVNAATVKKHAVLNTAVSLDTPYSEQCDESEPALVGMIPDKRASALDVILGKETLQDFTTSLSANERLVVSLIAEGYSYKEAAKILDCQPKTIDNALQRAKGNLKA